MNNKFQKCNRNLLEGWQHCALCNRSERRPRGEPAGNEEDDDGLVTGGFSGPEPGPDRARDSKPNATRPVIKHPGRDKGTLGHWTQPGPIIS